MAGEQRPSNSGAGDALGVQGGEGSLLRLTLLGGGVAVLLFVAAVAFLALVTEPAARREVLTAMAERQAATRAAQLGTLVSQLQQRVRAPLAAPWTVAAADEPRLAALLPEAARYRLFQVDSLGTARLDRDALGLANLIEVDLLRQALEDGIAGPEAYRVDSEMLVSIAASGPVQASGMRPVALASFPASLFVSALLGEQETDDRVAISQRQSAAGQERAVELGAFGSAATAANGTAAVAGAPWEISVQPGAGAVAMATDRIAPPYVALGLIFVGLLLGFGFLATAVPARVRRDVDLIVQGAASRSNLKLAVGELAPLARLVRQGKRPARRPEPMVKRAPAAVAPAGQPAAGAAADATTGDGDKTVIPAHIFRAYDIRGNAEQELTDPVVDLIGRAIGTLAGEAGEQQIILARDGRNSSHRLHRVICNALQSVGRDVVDIGLVPTPLAYYATHQLDARSAVIITGSHNPASDNGLKIVFNRQALAEGEIERIRDIALAGEFSEGEGERIEEDVRDAYIDEISEDVGIAVPLKLVIDASNGAGSEIAPDLFEALGCEVIQLYCDMDGDFPNHPPDTSVEANLSDLCKMVREIGADFGIALDGDADRVAIVTGAGEIVRSDVLLMLLAQDVVSRNPGTDVVFDVKCSRYLGRLVSRLGGRPVLWKTGHALMKAKMAETGALIGGEFSGHIFFGERWYGFDDGMYAAARLAEIVGSSTSSLDQLVGQMPSGTSTPEILVPVDEAEKFEIIRTFAEKANFDEGKVLTLDGVRVDYSDGWGLLRASNTSAALTARFEADSPERLQSIMNEFHEQLHRVRPELNIPF
jgi:phosphomannomutase/phosphoglucomutase